MERIDSSNSKLILVTGATGYLAANLIKILLENGHKVRGTVRSLKKKEKYEELYNLVPEKSKNLSFVECDLMKENGWDDAVKGVDWIAHLASPFFLQTPKDPEKELFLPAVNGVKFVLNAALKFNVKRIVLTSSVAAIAYGKDSHKKLKFDENDWSDNAPRFYDYSKYLAEKEAWKIYNANKDKLNLTCINPTLIVGKGLLKNHFASMDSVKAFFEMPALARLKVGVVNVKDVALAHYIAFMKPEITRGKRYLINSETVSFERISKVFAQEFNQYGYSFAKFHIPKCCFILFTLFNRETGKLAKFWNLDIVFDNTKSKQELGIKYTSWEKAIYEMVYDMIDRGMLKNKIKKKII